MKGRKVKKKKKRKEKKREKKNIPIPPHLPLKPPRHFSPPPAPSPPSPIPIPILPLPLPLPLPTPLIAKLENPPVHQERIRVPHLPLRLGVRAREPGDAGREGGFEGGG